MSKDQGDTWKHQELDIAASSDFMVVFEDVAGDGSQGNIAIDDLSFSEECLTPGPSEGPTPCNSLNSFWCANGLGCVSLSVKCDGKKDCQDGSDEKGCHSKCFKACFLGCWLATSWLLLCLRLINFVCCCCCCCCCCIALMISLCRSHSIQHSRLVDDVFSDKWTDRQTDSSIKLQTFSECQWRKDCPQA